MGEVWRARDTNLKRDVAIKVLPDSFASNPERLARFQREAEVLASLRHPNIATIHELVEIGGVHAIVMEYIEGPTLADRIRQGPVPLEEALPIARQIADALEAAHEKGITHRDFKPANSKTCLDGTVKVLDFGLAKVMAGEGVETSRSQAPTMSLAPTGMGVILGTAAYMPPEQAKGKTVDRRADIWSFGVVFFEMLTGKRVFDGEEVSEILAAVLRAEPDWDALPPDTPAVIRTMLRRCLNRDPRRRLRDMGEARIVIEDYLADPAGAAVRQERKGILSNIRFSWGVAIVLFVAALALGGVAYFRRVPEDTQPVRLSFSLPDTWSLSQRVTTSGASTAPLTVSPDGKRVAFVARGAEGRTQLWIRSLDLLGPQALAGTEEGSSPFWSPDSRFLGFFAGGKLKKIDVSGGPPITLCDTRDLVGGTWSQNGMIVFAPTSISALQKVSASGGVPTQATTLGQGELGHVRPWFLRDGRHFLYSARTGLGAGLIYLAALDSAERKLLLNSDSSNLIYSHGHLLFLRETTLMAQPFDSGRLELAGEAFPIAEQIQIQAETSVAYGVFSASGNGVLAYQRGTLTAGSQLVWFDRAGKKIGVLGDLAAYLDPELSPDGKRAAVSIQDQGKNTRDIWLYDVARGLRTRFTFDPADERTSTWSPDGGRIAFNSSRKGNFDIYQKASSGVGAEEVLLQGNLNAASALNWSPDGRFILFATSSGTPRTGIDLWVLPLSGDRKPFPFLQTQFNESGGRFSPDGRWVAYSSNESGTNQIYVAAFPGPGGKWQVSTAGAIYARWRHDGAEIIYLDPDNKLMAAAVNGKSSTFEVGAVKPLFQTRAVAAPRYQYDVSADGQQFLINTATEQATSAPITVVLNWTAGIGKK